MTGRERLLALLHRQPTDRLSWTTLVDGLSRSVMPPEVRELPVLDFYRLLGCDIFCFGNYGLPPELAAPLPARFHCPDVTTRSAADGDRHVQTTHTPWGELTAVYCHGHPVKHPVESLDDLRVLHRIWSHGGYEPVPGGDEAHARLTAALGDDGLFVPTLSPSPVQQLLELDMGLMTFYGLWQDQPGEVRGLLDQMHQRRLEEYDWVARLSPAPALIAVENTSTAMISPALFSQLSVPQLRDYADVCHRYGQRLVLHMCGHLRDLLSLLPATGFDAANAVTPPPVGNTTVEAALDAWGDDFPILGGVLDEAAFQSPQATPAAIHAALDALYTPRVRSAKLLLWAVADGLPTPLERFLAVRQWMADHGAQ